MLRVERLTAGGRGLLEDGQVVDRVLPGEGVGVEGDRIRILEPVPDRVKPPCRHFGRCGGCSMQHASDDFLKDWKVAQVRAALDAAGLPFPLRDVHVSGPRSRRRARFTGRRTKGGVMLGFMMKGTDTLIDTPECQLVTPAIAEARQRLEALVAAVASRKLGVSVTVTDSLDGLDIGLEGERPLDEPFRLELGVLARDLDFARLSWKDEVIVEARPPEQAFGPARVVPPPGAFLQATKAGEDALSAVVEEVTEGAKRVVDLFAGCGTFALRLTSRAAVLAVEGVPAQTGAMERAWRRAGGLHKLDTQTRNLFRDPVLAQDLDAFDAAVMDPPRAGAPAQTVEIAASGLRKVAMISCNPVTFARDCKALTDAGFRIDWIDVVDQFRWSTHVELAASLTRM